jgi:hypothetical protein
MASTGLFELGQRYAVFLKAAPHPASPDWRVRLDDYGSEIHFGAYGDRASPYGWERDHILALALGGTDDLANLRPLRCRENAALGGLLSNLGRSEKAALGGLLSDLGRPEKAALGGPLGGLLGKR